MSNSQKISSLPSGGTACSAPIKALNDNNAKGDLIVLISDNESWADMTRSNGTSAQAEWLKFKVRNPNARFVSIDLTPNNTAQLKSNSDVLFIGGFSDDCFMVIDLFARGIYNGNDFVDTIDRIELESNPVLVVAKAGAKAASDKRK
jgi:60 kDa SS-A/Ro ribonucleoprotein